MGPIRIHRPDGYPYVIVIRRSDCSLAIHESPDQLDFDRFHGLLPMLEQAEGEFVWAGKTEEFLALLRHNQPKE